MKDELNSSSPLTEIETACQLSWVTGSDSTRAECTVHTSRQAIYHRHAHASCILNEKESNKTTTFSEEGLDSTFDPHKTKYFEIKLSSSEEGGGNDRKDHLLGSFDISTMDTPILHNTIVVLPHLMSSAECQMLVEDAEHILAKNKAQNIQGCKTESWTVYSRFEKKSQEVMDRVLGDYILSFLELRKPDIAKKLTIDGSRRFTTSSDCHTQRCNARNTRGVYWDDPVVIKYIAGNQLAPHEDMRELTVVVPLNPLETVPLGGGGTRFWLEGTTPEDAANTDRTGGVSVKPSAGSGILFNGDITHSGNSVHSGTRFVLMTSITLDDDDDDEFDEIDDDDQD